MGRDRLGELGLDIMLLNYMLLELNVEVWAGFTWLRIWSSGRVL
jgi:hypothetical protein